jgi:hypothetical protein
MTRGSSKAPQSRIHSPTPNSRQWSLTFNRRVALGSRIQQSSSPTTVVLPMFSTNWPSDEEDPASMSCLSSAAPPPPMLHGCLANVCRGTSVTLTKSFCAPLLSRRSTIDRHTCPCTGSAGVLGSPRMPSTARTVWPNGGRSRPNRTTVGVPWAGMYAPEVSMTWSGRRAGRTLRSVSCRTRAS